MALETEPAIKSKFKHMRNQKTLHENPGRSCFSRIPIPEMAHNPMTSGSNVKMNWNILSIISFTCGLISPGSWPENT
jgi:hypothetical protein